MIKWKNVFGRRAFLFMFCIFLFLFVTGLDAIADDSSKGQPPAWHKSTEWNLAPSQAFDVLCFLNTLTADSFYLEYYPREYAEFAPKLTPAVKTALADLKRKVKDENGMIISASLCLYFSATNDSTVADLLKTIDESSTMQRNLKMTPYYSDEGWKLYESVKGDLKTILQFLTDIGFPDYWRLNILPKEKEKISIIERDLPQYNIIPEIESLIGFPLASDQITVYMLYYSQPHGIKITGTRFLTDVAWPFKIVLRNAVHEMMHPPFKDINDTAFVAAMKVLEKDDFLMDKVLHHDPSFGYNSFDGYIEEDCVQTLEQIINEKLNVAQEAHKRWQESDGGMHVFAVALYQVMKKEQYNSKHELFQDFLARMISSGELGPGRIKPLYGAFYAGASKTK